MKRLTAAGMVCAAWLACGQAPQAEPPAGLDAAVASDAGGALVDAGSGDAAEPQSDAGAPPDAGPVDSGRPECAMTP